MTSGYMGGRGGGEYLSPTSRRGEERENISHRHQEEEKKGKYIPPTPRKGEDSENILVTPERGEEKENIQPTPKREERENISHRHQEEEKTVRISW